MDGLLGKVGRCCQGQGEGTISTCLFCSVVE